MNLITTLPAVRREPALQELPIDVRKALDEVDAVIVILNREMASAIADLAFKRAGEFRERAATLKQSKEKIIRDWQQTIVACSDEK